MDRIVHAVVPGWLKECRGMATRYEKLAVNDLGLVKVAIIQRYLRVLTRSVSRL